YRSMIREQLASSLTGTAFKDFDATNISSNPPSRTPGLKVGTPVAAPAVMPPAPPLKSPSDLDSSQFSSNSPVNGVITSPVGWRRDPIDGTTKFHKGTDYAAPAGTPI